MTIFLSQDKENLKESLCSLTILVATLFSLYQADPLLSTQNSSTYISTQVQLPDFQVLQLLGS